jgi:hypothetical protein
MRRAFSNEANSLAVIAISPGAMVPLLRESGLFHSGKTTIGGRCGLAATALDGSNF